jgi:hypothetical protein
MKGNLLVILCNARKMEHIEIINPYHYKCSFFSYLFRYIAEYVACFCTLAR